MNPSDRIQQIRAQRERIEHPVTEDDIEIARELQINIDMLEKMLPKMRQAGFDTDGVQEQLRNSKDQLNKLLRTFG